MMDELSEHAFTHENQTDYKYYKKCNAILRRCKTIQKENEMLVSRVYRVKKIVRNLRKERKFLMTELDKKGDCYRSLPLTIAIQEEEKFAFPQTSSLPALGRPRSSGGSSSTSASKKQISIKREKERDPTAPKRPSNAFLQFCQDQREATTAKYLQLGRPMDKKQLSKILAARWSLLSDEEKRIYVEKFERDKERYSEERKLYENRKNDC